MKTDKHFDITVDGEAVEVPRKDVTAKIIIELAGLDPDRRYLIEIIGQNRESYKNKADDPIKTHQNQVFVTGKLGPVQIS